MNAEAILSVKGSAVHTTLAEARIADAVRGMRADKVGALVVVDDGRRVVGMITERDILRGLADFGARLLEKSVGELMSRNVRTAPPEASVDHLMRMMTEGRFRHVPVIRNGVLVGVVSIGDVVKSRLENVEHEATQLRNYIAHG